MANHKSAIKRNRQNARRNERNTGHRTRVKNETKKVLAAVQENNAKAAQQALTDATKTISKVASKGILHKRAAARKISGLARKVHQLAG